jgi:hypothetical protein
MLFSAALLAARCGFDSGEERQERYVTVRLNDSLKRYDSVDIAILAAADTSKVIGTLWSGKLAEPGSIPSYPLAAGEDREVSVRVSGFDAKGRMLMNMLIARKDGKQVVTDLPAGGRGWAQAYEEWAYRRVIDLKLTEMGWSKGAKVKGFPLLVRMTDPLFPFSQADGSGNDIRFSTLDGKPLPYEISGWKQSNGKGLAEIWVRMDSLGIDPGMTALAVYWGNPSATSESDGAKVFAPEDGYGTVLHFREQGDGTANEYKDATGKNPGTGGGNGKVAPKRTDGMIGYGQEFAPGVMTVAGIDVATTQNIVYLPRTFDPGEQFWTFQAWVRFNAQYDGAIFSKGDEFVAGRMRFQILAMANSGQIVIAREGAIYKTGVSLPAGRYADLGVVYNGNRIELYVDGMLRASQAWTQGGEPIGWPVLGGSTGGAGIGTTGQVDGFGGSLDEVWIGSKPRTAEWVRLSYETQKTDSKIATLRAR